MQQFSPIPTKFGYGFSASEPLPEGHGYKYEKVGIYHNYYFTLQNYNWPEELKHTSYVVDGFSPNLNKYLHAGHLKNLAVAAAVTNISAKGEAVAMLGASLGQKPGAYDDLMKWYELAGYEPTIWKDTDLPTPNVPLIDGEGEYVGCKMYNGVVIYKSDGKPTYAAHDLAFAEIAKPDFYLTGAEQQEHFASIGLGQKHQPIGLLLGEDGKKMKSTIKKEGEEANVASATELFDLIKNSLDTTPNPDQLAWNILAWQFNSAAKHSNTKFNLKQWSNPNTGGLYISYTYAKMKSALKKAEVETVLENNPNAKAQVNENHLPVLGTMAYFTHAFNAAATLLEPHHLAHYAFGLAKTLAGLYAQEKFVGGDAGTLYVAYEATELLGDCMALLGMYPLESI